LDIEGSEKASKEVFNMFEEIQKQAAETIQGWSERTRKVGVKFVSFVISLWLIAGAFGLGIVAPVYAVRFLAKTQWMKDAHADISAKTTEGQIQNLRSNTVIRSQWQPAEERYLVAPRRVERSVSVRNSLRETRNSVNELRNLIRGIESFKRR
jgi:hypothetical protein